jgi:hypothetical protein
MRKLALTRITGPILPDSLQKMVWQPTNTYVPLPVDAMSRCLNYSNNKLSRMVSSYPPGASGFLSQESFCDGEMDEIGDFGIDAPMNGDDISDNKSCGDLPVFGDWTNNVDYDHPDDKAGEEFIVRTLISDLKSEIKQFYTKFDCKNCLRRKERVEMALNYIRKLNLEIDEDMYVQGEDENGAWVTSNPQLTKRQKRFHASRNCL